MAPTPSSKSNSGQGGTLIRTPQAKHRLQFNSSRTPHPSPNPNSTVKDTTAAAPAEHPVEVIGRVRDYPDRKDKPASILQVNPDRQGVRVRTDFGYRDFTLDGVSLSEEQDLDGFYKKFVESRINGVKLGDKCTIMMYGPTGSGKSHTMFGCSKQPGIVYKSLKDILGEGQEEGGVLNDQRVGVGTFVQVTVLEIYNEEIYDLLPSNGVGGLGFGWPKAGSASKVRLEVMGKKAKNATYISGTEAGKISKEIQKVEKRRIVKSTLCNDRSSRSHCMIILDVPTVGGRLMLVDMAGSENIEQAGQIGFEAKMQTAKINQGNIALKRVVESIANGDSHVPFRDSKLTMLLQDSFEDDKSKILMILCASPDPKEIHKTISTLEYGAKAKCIVRGPHTPIKDKICSEDSSAVILGSRIAAMDQFIYKLQMENKLREKERNEAHKELLKKEEEVAALRSKLELVEGKGLGASEEEINLKVNERTQFLRRELEKKLEECQRMTNDFVELERRRMEEKLLQQQEEVEMLRRRLEEIEYELHRSRDGNVGENGSREMEGSGFAKRLMGIYANEDPGMVKSMDLDMGDQEPIRDVHLTENNSKSFLNFPCVDTSSDAVIDHGVFVPKYGDKTCLSTVFEEEEEELKENMEDEEVEKEIVEEKRVCSGDTDSSRRMRIHNIFTLCGNHRELSHTTTIPCETRLTIDPQASLLKTVGEDSELEVFTKMNNNQNSDDNQIPCDGALVSVKLASEQKLTEPQMNKKQISDDTVLSLKENIDPIKENIGDQTDAYANQKENLNPIKENIGDQTDAYANQKENLNPIDEILVGQTEVYVKWEASKENPGKFITTLKVPKDASLSELRKLIEIQLGSDNQAFTFLVLEDPTGAPVPREKEATVRASKLPVCNNQLRGHLACLRPAKGFQGGLKQHIPLSSLENKLPLTPNLCSKQQAVGFSPKVDQSLSSTPYITSRRHRLLSP